MAGRSLSSPSTSIIVAGSILLASMCAVARVALILADDANSLAPWLAALLEPEFGPYLLWGFVTLVLLFVRRGQPDPEIPASASPTGPGRFSRVVLGVVMFLLGVSVAGYAGFATRHLPPLYHDEYSYLFQAETFLAGRLAFPTPPLAEHFRQVHVLCDDGVYASRYFPGTGLWLAPFVHTGISTSSGWIAQGLIASFLALAASRQQLLAGWITGTLIAFSPGLVVFGQTLLSPHPTMVGLAIGWWGIVEGGASGSSRKKIVFGLIAGIAIGFAFLTRPLTAVAIAAPWGGWLLQSLVGSTGWRANRSWVCATIVGFAPALYLLALHNHALTGSFVQSGYSVYTERYTPSHAFGFFNQTRAHQAEHPEIDAGYDDWSTELDLKTAFSNTHERILSAVLWTGGLLPVVTMAILGIGAIRQRGDLIVLPLLSLFGLAAAYFPYQYLGIMGWSYLLEAVPFALFVMGLGLANAIRELGRSGQVPSALALAVLPILLAGTSLFVTLPTALGSPGSELVYPRLRMAERLAREEQLSAGQPTIILYEVDSRKDLHSTWVFNDPAHHGLIVRGWRLDPADDLSSLWSHYPGRQAFVYRSGVYQRIR